MEFKMEFVRIEDDDDLEKHRGAVMVPSDQVIDFGRNLIESIRTFHITNTLNVDGADVSFDRPTLAAVAQFTEEVVEQFDFIGVMTASMDGDGITRCHEKVLSECHWGLEDGKCPNEESHVNQDG